MGNYIVHNLGDFRRASCRAEAKASSIEGDFQDLQARLLLMGYTKSGAGLGVGTGLALARTYPDETSVTVMFMAYHCIVNIQYPSGRKLQFHRTFEDTQRLLIRNHRPRAVRKDKRTMEDVVLEEKKYDRS